MFQRLFGLRNRLFGVNQLTLEMEQRHHALLTSIERLEAVAESNRAELDRLVSAYAPAQCWESFDVRLLARYEAGLDLLTHCARQSQPDDLVLEFGSWSGRTISHLAEQLPEHTLYGFDSFLGLPENWRSDFPQGHFSRENLPAVPSNAQLVVGWFADTLPGFLAEHLGQVGLVHIDCDLYSSTKTVLTLLAPRLRDQAVLVFDEFFIYPGWEYHEFRAFSEFTEEHGFGWEYLGCNPRHQQVAVRLRIDSQEH